MSAAWPLATPLGWCSITLVFGSTALFPLVPVASKNPDMPMQAPKPIVPTSDFRYRIVSCSAKEGTTSPPVQLM